METDSLTEIEELENEVLEDIGENPFRTFSVIFPYQVRLTFEDDDANTEVVINTKSKEVLYARTTEDAHLLKQLQNSHSSNGYAKILTEWVREQLWGFDPEKCHVTYTGKPQITEMTEKEIKEYEREVLSAN